ncbi:transposase [Polynucleobacter sp. IMCC30063]|uniref:transposase n=1 Tax=Polynucleobacter sp. IMCC30063 TaxID=2907298 RepID=UPI001F467CA5|nr:transposase [Polynucleobacter sp. IMCC30063]MCE7505936.1 transposase [Polynucleobacter sp. IMCC30063]
MARLIQGGVSVPAEVVMVGKRIKIWKIDGEWVKLMTKGNPFRDNHVRPHSALGYRPPAPQTQVPQVIQNQPILLQ